MRNALLELAFATIASKRDAESQTVLPSLHMIVRRWIEDHIFEPDLSPSTIAAAHTVSVRTLQRAFASHPCTLTDVVRDRKLERARDLLNDPEQTIGGVSARLNFANQSHFSRLFLSRYRMTPGQYREQCRTRNAALPCGTVPSRTAV
jgi:AraC-like DNA-binding protein